MATIGWSKSNNVIKYKQVKLFACGNIHFDRFFSHSPIHSPGRFSDIHCFYLLGFFDRHEIAAAAATVAVVIPSFLLTRPEDGEKKRARAHTDTHVRGETEKTMKYTNANRKSIFRDINYIFLCICFAFSPPPPLPSPLRTWHFLVVKHNSKPANQHYLLIIAIAIDTVLVLVVVWQFLLLNFLFVCLPHRANASINSIKFFLYF